MGSSLLASAHVAYIFGYTKDQNKQEPYRFQASNYNIRLHCKILAIAPDIGEMPQQGTTQANY